MNIIIKKRAWQTFPKKEKRGFFAFDNSNFRQFINIAAVL